MGPAQTRPIMWTSMLGNFLRLPLGWPYATGTYGILPSALLGTAGMWWSINLTTMLKAYLFSGRVQNGNWLRNAPLEETRRSSSVQGWMPLYWQPPPATAFQCRLMPNPVAPKHSWMVTPLT